MILDSTPLQALKRFNGTPTTDAEVAEQFEIMKGLGHRGALSLGASILDDALVFTLKRRMRRLTPAETYQLFEDTGPMSTFAARINTAYAFSLLSKRTSEAMHIIRLLRDTAGLPRNAFSFQTMEIRQAAMLLPPLLGPGCKWRHDDFSAASGDAIRDMVVNCIILLREYVLAGAEAGAAAESAQAAAC